MKKSGNSKPELCAMNLLRIVRGEVAFDRVRGRDAALIDAPSTTVEAVADAEWLLDNYEPRVTSDMDLATVEAVNGDFTLLANIQRKEGAS